MRAPLFNPSSPKADTPDLRGERLLVRGGLALALMAAPTSLWASVVSALDRVSGERVVVFCTFVSAIIDCIKDVCSVRLGSVNTVEQDDICSMPESVCEFFFVVLTLI